MKAPVHQATIDLSMFWQHSVATGVISKVLAANWAFKHKITYILLALSTMWSKIILDRFMHDVYKEIVKNNL